MDKKIQESCDLTREMYGLISNLQQSFQSSNKSVLVERGRTLGQLHRKIVQLDLEVEEYIESGALLSAQQREVLDGKKQMQKEVLILQKSLVPQINNIKSTLASEMSSLKKGRTALKGYGNISKGPGRVINKSL